MIGDGRRPVVEAIVAVPWTLVGDPNLSGEKLAVTVRVSAAHTAAATDQADAGGCDSCENSDSGHCSPPIPSPG